MSIRIINQEKLLCFSFQFLEVYCEELFRFKGIAKIEIRKATDVSSQNIIDAKFYKGIKSKRIEK